MSRPPLRQRWPDLRRDRPGRARRRWSEAEKPFLIVFGVLAGGAFLLGAILLVRFDRRWLWVVGVIFQVFVYWAYFDVAKTRTPPFELWGITLRIIQLPLLAALIHLAVRGPQRTPEWVAAPNTTP